MTSDAQHEVESPSDSAPVLDQEREKYRMFGFEKGFQIRPLAPREVDPVDNVPSGTEWTKETVAEYETAQTLHEENSSDEQNNDTENGARRRALEAETSTAANYYDKTLKPNPEVTGWTMESCAQGPYHNSSLYVGNSILTFAIAESMANGTGTVYGFQPTSLLTLGSTVLGIVVALTCPLIGAVVDHTPYRRGIGAITAGILCLITIVQVAILHPSRWLATLILYIVGGFFFHIHIAALLAYLPDLTHYERNISHYTARFHMSRNAITVIYYVIVTAVTMPLKRGSLFTSRVALGVVLVIILPLFSYPWIFLFQPRPALRPVPKGDTLLSTGFKQTYKTLINTWTNYPALRFFMLSLLWSPDAGSGTYLAIAVTFLTTVVGLTGSEMGLVSCIMIFLGIPGSMLAKWMCNEKNAFLSFRLSMIFFSATLVFTGLVLTGPERKNWSYAAAVFWGFAFGWFTPSQRVLYCTLTPRGQEMEYMGFFTFCQMIIGWCPSLIYTVMNEAGVPQKYCMSFLAIYPLVSLMFSMFSGSYNDAVSHAGSFIRDSKRHSSDVGRKNTALPPPEDADAFAVEDSSMVAPNVPGASEKDRQSLGDFNRDPNQSTHVE